MQWYIWCDQDPTGFDYYHSTCARNDIHLTNDIEVKEQERSENISRVQKQLWASVLRVKIDHIFIGAMTFPCVLVSAYD